MALRTLCDAAMSVAIFAIASAILISAPSQAQAQVQQYPNRTESEKFYVDNA